MITTNVSGTTTILAIMSNTTNARTSDEYELRQPSFLAVHVRNSVVVSRRNRKRFGPSMYLSYFIFNIFPLSINPIIPITIIIHIANQILILVML